MNVRERKKAIKEGHSEPWTLYPLWEGGKVYFNGKTTIYIFTAALVVSAIIVLFLLIVRPFPLEGSDNPHRVMNYLPLVVPLILVVILALEIAHYNAYGDSELVLDTFPGQVGGEFKATLFTGVPSVQPEYSTGDLHSFFGRLLCLRQTCRWRRGTKREYLWEQEKTFQAESCKTPYDDQLKVSVQFSIPQDLPKSSGGDMGGQESGTRWILTVNNNTLTPSYSFTADVPVYCSGT